MDTFHFLSVIDKVKKMENSENLRKKAKLGIQIGGG